MPDLTDDRAGDPAVEMALTRALLAEVAGGRPPLVRVLRPDPTVAFGRRDATRPGFAAAAAAARAHGFEPVLRSAGGHAVAYDAGSVLVERIVPVAEIAAGVRERFAGTAEEIAGVLRGLGVDARVGALPGEYCAGEHSVHVAGERKVAGIAQRVVRGAALVTAALVVEGPARIRAVVADVYDALGIDHDPRVTGAVVGADGRPDAATVEAALRRHLGAGAAPVPAGAAAWTAARARAHRHRVG